eukprot:CAMPEP_0115132662 /NCGR_PEP_ID=MMETSP0227-20121206/53901_1 /TAXON_ID=89957 /ORGANISM="Polarella glacialis, Strain CCMP 1383" /LENGTH=265 /DNA_ID=CAMNT_0002538527 /DNA_START=286 /DNA_END=1083 /DNA_ORIENTATION=-
MKFATPTAAGGSAVAAPSGPIVACAGGDPSRAAMSELRSCHLALPPPPKVGKVSPRTLRVWMAAAKRRLVAFGGAAQQGLCFGQHLTVAGRGQLLQHHCQVPHASERLWMISPQGVLVGFQRRPQQGLCLCRPALKMQQLRQPSPCTSWTNVFRTGREGNFQTGQGPSHQNFGLLDVPSSLKHSCKVLCVHELIQAVPWTGPWQSRTQEESTGLLGTAQLQQGPGHALRHKRHRPDLGLKEGGALGCQAEESLCLVAFAAIPQQC